MPKIDFSALKTADLRSVAPVDESARPSVHSESAAVSAEAVAATPVSIPVAAVPAVSPVAESPAATAPASVAKPAAKRISLTSLKAGGPSAPSVAKISLAAAPAAVPAAVPAPVVQNPVPEAVSAKPAISLVSAKRPAIALPIEKPVADEAPEAIPTEVATVSEAPVSEETKASETEVAVTEERAPVEGVDIIEAAKVIGTEGEAKANEILSEALMDPEEARKAAEERAVQAVVIPESSKEFFTNLKVMDDMFDDDMFDGIVPKKEVKPEAVAEAVDVPMEKTIVETVETAEGKAAETPESVEPAPAPPAVSVTEEVAESETPAAETPSETPAALSVPPAQYVESVAKDLSIERKGGLAKLFGERKVLVRSAAGLLAVAVIAGGALTLPSFKTSAPEAVPTAVDSVEKQPVGGNALAQPEQIPEPLPIVQPSPVYKVNSIRKPNIRTKSPATASGSSVAPNPLAAPAEAPRAPEPGKE